MGTIASCPFRENDHRNLKHFAALGNPQLARKATNDLGDAIHDGMDGAHTALLKAGQFCYLFTKQS
jgi:hypothetical protein